MKFTRVLAVVVAVLFAFSGCTSRNNNNNTTVPDVISDAADAIGDGVSDVEDFFDGDDNSGHDVSGIDEDRVEDETEEDIDETSSIQEDEQSDWDELEESVAAAMSTDFAEIGALDATKRSEFPGGPVDERNRPSGPLSFQEQYKHLDALFIDPDANGIYLTFDEGYENGYTPKLLQVLKEKQVKAVFFITYDFAVAQPELVKQMIDDGHVVGNHSTKHKSFPDLPLQEAAKDIMTLHEYVKKTFNYEMYLFRPPMGEFSEQTLALAQSLGYKTVFWSFAYLDYDVDNQPITIEAVDKITSKAHPGAIYLLHAVSKTNSMVLDECIDWLQDNGYEFLVFER